jgi:uncharacterized protein
MHLIVDAFNVLHAWATGPDSGGRHEIESLSGLIHSSRYAAGRVSIVCDGAQFPTGKPTIAAPHRVIFAGGGKEADAVIESLISRDSGPRDLLVASSDRRIQRAARKRGSRWLTSEKFLAQIIRDSTIPDPAPLRPGIAPRAPLAPNAVDRWLNEFDIPADFGGPASRTKPPSPTRTPPKENPRASPPLPVSPSPPLTDPLLKEALKHWQGRLSASDLDMKRWLDDDGPR